MASGEDEQDGFVESPDVMTWLDKEVIRQVIEKYDAALVVQDRAPAWAVVTAMAYYCATSIGLLTLTQQEIFDRVRADLHLKNALLAGYKMGAGGIELLQMIESWERNQE